MVFFDGLAMREDPATGGCNAGLAQYLHRLGVRGRFAVEQGFEIRRPSRIYHDLREHDLHEGTGAGVPVAVGGRVQAVAEGRLL
jgi:predicted PhzF superfamily epimerase YddE/YHI9